MPKQRNKGKKFKGKGRNPNYMDETQYGYQGQPKEETDVKVGLSQKALSKLPHSSYSIKADPYQAALPGSEPYPLISRFNHQIGGSYGGEDNIDGGNVQQYADSVKSKFLDYADVGRVKVKINYAFLPNAPQSSSTYKGKLLIDEVRKAISEAISVLMSTTYTQMEINNFVIKTNLPMGSAEKVSMDDGSHTAVQVFTNKADVFYAMSMFYQTVLQDIANMLRWHNSFRLKQGTAIRNAWNREVALLNSLFGLFNKKSWLNLVDSLNLLFEGEYFDKAFCDQAGMVNYAPSRRSNSITDPVIEIQTEFEHCTEFKVYIVREDKLVWDSTKSDYATVFEYEDLSASINGVKKNLFDVIEEINDKLSLEATTFFARNTTYTGVASTDNARFNSVKALLDYVIVIMNKFKPKWSDYRQALDTLARANIVKWSKGFRPAIEKATDAPLYHNLLCDDIVQLLMSGADELTFDQYTKRFRTFAPWNMYYGTPEYASKQGGSFLTYSFKNVVGSDDDGTTQYLPILFELKLDESNNPIIQMAFVTRNGSELIVKPEVKTISEVKVLSRLVPLDSQASLKIRVPTLRPIEDQEITEVEKSCLYKTLTQVFGLCNVPDYDEDDNVWIDDFSLDPDILAVYQLEITDTTNIAINYARNAGPIYGTSAPSTLIGFSGFKVASGRKATNRDAK